MASDWGRPGVGGPFAFHTMSSRQPVRPFPALGLGVKTNYERSSMSHKSKRRGTQTAERESDRRVVPEKPGNSGGGKATTPSRSLDRAPTARSDGPSVLTRLNYITERAQEHTGEVFNNLYHLLNYELLWYAFRKLKSNKPPGNDGVTVETSRPTCRKTWGTWLTVEATSLSSPPQPATEYSQKGRTRRDRWALRAWRTRSFSERS